MNYAHYIEVNRLVGVEEEQEMEVGHGVQEAIGRKLLEVVVQRVEVLFDSIVVCVT